MGATNSTPNYELSQFIGTDKPAWLQDYNGDMSKIDTGIAGAKTAADNAQSAADGAQGDATSALSAIADINTELGTVENVLSTATGNINTINSLIGNGTPTTTDQTIIGAINELHADIRDTDSALNGKFIEYAPEVSYTRQGVSGETFAAAIVNALDAFYNDVIANLSTNLRVKINSVTIGAFVYTSSRELYFTPNSTGVNISVTRVLVDSNGADFRDIQASNTVLGRFYQMHIDSAGAAVLSDRSSNSFSDNIVITYEMFERLVTA